MLVHSQLMSSLLSLRALQTNASSTIRNIETETALIRDLIKVVDLEKIDLQKAQTMNVYLQDRLNRLGAERQILSDRNPHEVASGIISNLESRLRSSNQDSRLLSGALNEFIKDHLAVLVAAEELGGPIVGASVEVDDDDLDAGYNVRGQARKSTNSQRASVRPGDQRDLETSWGRSTEPSEATGAKARSSTADELRELLETLLNATAQANAGSGSSPYLDIAKESAAIRFLVRVHVAQYHPRDPSRVRLIDFMAMHAD